VIGLAIFTGASALCGAAQSPLMLELARGLQGVGGAIMFSVSLALLANAFRGKERGVAFAVWGAITGVAVAIGPIVGGVSSGPFVAVDLLRQRAYRRDRRRAQLHPSSRVARPARPSP